MSYPQGPMGAPAAAAGGTPPEGRERLAAWLQFPRRALFLAIGAFLAWGAVFLLVWGSADPLATLTGGRPISAEARQRLVQQYGLDQPLLAQYFRWLGGALQGDLGTSALARQPVGEMIVDRLPNSLLLVGTALLLALLLAAVSSLLALLAHWLEERSGAGGSVLKGLGRLAYFCGCSGPPAVLALSLLYVFGVQLRWLPLFGMHSPQAAASLDDTLRHLVLPATALAALPMLLTAQAASRALTLPAASGGRHWLAGLLHGLATLCGQVGGLVSAMVVIEAIFSWPGIGRLAYEAAVQFDLTLFLGVLFACSLVVLAGRLLSELFRWLERLVCRPPETTVEPSPWRKKARRIYLVAALVLLLLPLGLTLAGLVVDPAWADRTDRQAAMAPPSAEHPGGTDSLGRDLLARGLRGAGLSLVGAGLAAGLVLVPALLGGALTGFLASLRRLWSESLADLLLLGTDALLLIPAIPATMLLMLPERRSGGWRDIEWLGLAVAVALVLLPRALRAAQTLWLAAPGRHRWLTVGLAGPGALLLGALFAAFGLGLAVDLLGMGVSAPAITLGAMLGGSIEYLIRYPIGLLVAGVLAWVCAVVLYTAADAVIGFFTSKGVMARLNE